MSAVRERLARRIIEELERQGKSVIVDPKAFRPVTGRERWDHRFDTYRWSIPIMVNGVIRVLDSYYTMTECARYGVEIDLRNSEVFAREGDL